MPTPFQASLQPASFRGVRFIVEGNGGEVGRRGQVHEYWGRDEPYAEDGGRRARRIEFKAFVLGEDCAAQRDALLAALEEKGPGMLVHPNMAPRLMQPDPARPTRFREDWDKNGRIEFDLAFVEPGRLQYPLAGADTQAESGSAADGIDTAANGDFQTGADGVATGATRSAALGQIQGKGQLIGSPSEAGEITVPVFAGASATGTAGLGIVGQTTPDFADLSRSGGPAGAEVLPF